MKKIETLLTSIGLIAIIVVTGTTIWNIIPTQTQSEAHEYPTNKYGAFLAGQHAIYINDFKKAAEFSKDLPDTDIPVIRNTVILSEFLNGKIPESAKKLENDTGSANQLIFDAYLIQKNDWAGVYKRHKNDESILASPLRIWSGVANGKTEDVLKFISGLKTTDSWKSFISGQIYAETGKIDLAVEQFARVPVDFININDFLYMTAFYNNNKMNDAAKKLHDKFTERPGGMYLLDITLSPKWSDFSGFNNALAFSMIQNVSHTSVMMYSDMALLLLRFAQVVQQNGMEQNDAINYYLGQYFVNNGGNIDIYFKSIDKTSPFYPLGIMKSAEKTGKMIDLERVIHANPLFVPAITKLVAKNIQAGNRDQALKIINRALKNNRLTESGRAFFLKTRAHIYLSFNDIESAQNDIFTAAKITPMDAGILAVQSRIWAIQKRELDTAYQYAVALVTKNPIDIESWDVLGVVVLAKEGPNAALEVIEKVAQVSETCSSLFEHLGDLQSQLGHNNLARDAYLRAIELSDDGLTVVPVLEKKLRNIK